VQTINGTGTSDWYIPLRADSLTIISLFSRKRKIFRITSQNEHKILLKKGSKKSIH